MFPCDQIRDETAFFIHCCIIAHSKKTPCNVLLLYCDNNPDFRVFSFVFSRPPEGHIDIAKVRIKRN